MQRKMIVIQGHYHSHACTLAVFRAGHNNVEIPYFVTLSIHSIYDITFDLQYHSYRLCPINMPLSPQIAEARLT